MNRLKDFNLMSYHLANVLENISIRKLGGVNESDE